MIHVFVWYAYNALICEGYLLIDEVEVHFILEDV